MGKDYKYYAFISYSHKDLEWAKWLQHELEYYQLPTTLNSRMDLPKLFRPTFRDEDELSGGDLKSQILEALSTSDYLIIICSPNSAQSKYVDNEIRDFIKIGEKRKIDNRKKIFPFIIEGKPHQDTGHKGEECFPPILNEISDDEKDPVELIAGDINATGREHAFIKILAGTLREKNVQFSDLWDRYEHEKIEEEHRKREERNRLLLLESRFLSEKAQNLIEEGDTFLARLLAIKALPQNLEDINERPYSPEAEAALRIASDKDSAILRTNFSVINHVCFSPNGKQYLSAADNTICIWDIRTGEKLRTFIELGSTFLSGNKMALVKYASFTPSGEYIISAADDETVRLWNVNTGEGIRKFAGHIVVSSPNERFIATVTFDEQIHIWDVETGKELQIINGHPKIEGVRKGDLLTTLNITDTISTINFGNNSVINSIMFSPNGNEIITAAWDYSARIWDVKSGLELQKFEGHSHAVTYAAYSPNGKHVVTASFDKTIRIWDVETGQEIQKFECNKKVKYAAYNHSGKLIIVVYNDDNTVYILNTNNGEVVYKKKLSSAIRSVSCYNEKLIVVACNDNTLRFWNINDCVGLERIKINHDRLSFCAISSDISMLATVEYNKSHVSIWDINTGDLFTEIISRDGAINKITFMPDGKQIVVGASNVNIYDIETGNKLNTFQDYDITKDIVISPDGMYMISIPFGDFPSMWNVKNGTKLRSYEWLNDELEHLSFSPNGKELISSAWNNTVCVWDVESGEKIACLRGHTMEITSIMYSLDGKKIVSGSKDDTIRIWDTSTWEELCRIQCHSGIVSFVSFSPDGKLVASISHGVVYVWNINNQKEIYRINMNTKFIRSVQFCKNGEKIIIILEDGTIYKKDFEHLQNLIDRTNERFQDRPLTIEEKQKYYLE